uniref:Ig-like domain-containing protein n=1 Tax=Calidris pygmaea TaxID=425635 RepID=A0A8C3J4U6_9CHAR
MKSLCVVTNLPLSLGIICVCQALQQSPDTVVREGDSVTLNCSQKGSTFSAMYWYKLPTGKDATLQLVVYSVEGGRADIEKEFRNHFQSNGAKGYRLSVEIDYALLNDSGTYFCAKADCTVTQSLEQLSTNLSMQRGVSAQRIRPVFDNRAYSPLALQLCLLPEKWWLSSLFLLPGL